MSESLTAGGMSLPGSMAIIAPMAAMHMLRLSAWYETSDGENGSDITDRYTGL